MEQEHLLAHQADGAAQVGQLQLVDRNAIEQDLAPLQLIKPQQQFHDRALARACSPHDADGATGRYLQVEVPQQRFSAAVSEIHSAEVQGAAHLVEGQGAIPAGDRDGGVD